MANTYITQEVFENILQSMLKDAGYETEIVDAPGLDKTKRQLIKKRTKDTVNDCIPAIRLNELYDEYMEKRPMLQEIIDLIIEIFNQDNMIDARKFANMAESWDEAKNHLYLSVYNKYFHKSYIEDAIYEEIEDIALTVRICFESSPDGILSSVVKKGMLDLWGVSKEEVIKAAKENAPKLFPAQISSMKDFINDAIARNELIFPDCEIKELDKVSPMIIISAKDILTGASLFYDGVLEQLSKILGDTFFIIPSSIHEFIAIPEDYIYSASAMASTITYANNDHNAVPDGEKLADHGYIYKNGKFSSYVK